MLFFWEIRYRFLLKKIQKHNFVQKKKSRKNIIFQSDFFKVHLLIEENHFKAISDRFRQFKCDIVVSQDNFPKKNRHDSTIKKSYIIQIKEYRYQNHSFCVVFSQLFENVIKIKKSYRDRGKKTLHEILS